MTRTPTDATRHWAAAHASKDLESERAMTNLAAVKSSGAMGVAPNASVESKTFDARDVAFAATGICLRAGQTFSLFAEIASHVLGYPVWTHELPSLGARVGEMIREQWPECPSGKPADWRACADDLAARFPDGVTLKRGAEVRRADPLSTLRDMVGDRDVLVIAPQAAR